MSKKSIDLEDLLAAQLRDQGKRCIASPYCSGLVTQLSSQGHGLCERHQLQARTKGIQLAVGWSIRATP
jgi:hypothetical protein